MEEVLLQCGELLPIAKSGISTRQRGDGIRLIITVYSSITQSHLEYSLRVKGFVLMQDNDPKHTSRLCQKYIKSKEEQHILQLVSWPVQSMDLNSIDLVRDDLTEKSELNNPQAQLTSRNSCGNAGQNYLQSITNLWRKEWQESVKHDSCQKGVTF